jgi:hypothetical protein
MEKYGGRPAVRRIPAGPSARLEIAIPGGIKCL